MPGSPTVAPLGDYGCLEETVVLEYDIITSTILSQAIANYQSSNPNTSLNTVSTYWKLKLTLDGVTITSPTNFFVGNGTNGGLGESFPSDSVVDAAVNTFFTSPSVINALTTEFYNATPDTVNNKIYLTTTNCQQADLQVANLDIDLLVSALSNTADGGVYWVKLEFNSPNTGQLHYLIFRRTSLSTVNAGLTAFSPFGTSGTVFNAITPGLSRTTTVPSKWRLGGTFRGQLNGGTYNGTYIYFTIEKSDAINSNYPANLGWTFTTVNNVVGQPVPNPALVGLTGDVDVFYSTDPSTTSVNNVNWSPNPSNIII